MRSAGRARPDLLRVVLVVGLAVVVAGCIVETGPVPSNGPGSSSTIGTFGPPDADTPAPSGPVSIDPSLLAILPKEVKSIPVTESPEGDSDALADDVLPTIASAAVAAVAVDADASDLAYALVVKLLPKAMSDDIFRDWRDSYDAGACAGDSQVIGHAEEVIAGNKVYIGTCATGLRTYHTWLKDKDILISISSTGQRQLGLAMLEHLRL